VNVCSPILILHAFLRLGVIIAAVSAIALYATGPTLVMASGPRPNILRITPNVTSAGGPGFTLAVNGPGFVVSSVVQWNGASRPSSFDSATQELKAAIPASDIAAAGVARITVLNPDGQLSAPATLVIASRESNRVTPKFFVVPILGPVLVSVSPGIVAQGARQARLTLVGANFRPGARVVISSAADIKIESVTRISSTVINAVITVGDRGAEGIRMVDVFNTDGTNTGPSHTAAGEITGTSKPLRVTSHSSLGAPLGVQTMVITYPRSGTVLSRGDRVFASAILGGTGSGTITGQWVLDNNVIEQFAVPMTGGERVLLKTAQSLPTFNLGLHTLELRITGPNLLSSRPVEIVVNPGEWKLMRLIAPRSGAGFTPDSPPLLRWDIVPGAAAYQVGFSAKPFFNAVDEWHDVDDTQWRVPGEIWARLPEGELYWTVRVVETSGQTREPASMRRVQRLPSGVLAATRATPTRTSGGTSLLEWEGLGKNVVYRVTVTSDLDGRDIVRRFFVAQPHLDLHSIEGSLQPGQTYYWLVEAYSSKGGLIIAGPRNSFIVDSKRAEPKQITLVRYQSDSRSASSVASNDKIASRSPAPNERVTDARPLVRVEFKSGAFPSELALVVDATDVTALAEATEPSITFKPVVPLKNGEHEITITIGSVSDSWRFVVEQGKESVTTSNAMAAATQAETEQPPAPEGAAGAVASGGAEKPANAGGFTMEAGLNTQLVSGSENETNTLSLAVKEAQQHGVWKVEMNGTGTLNSVVGPSERHQSLGKFSDYIIHMAGDGKLWGSDSRFGLISPTVFNGSDFITTAIPRIGFESTLRTPVGALGFFRNTDDIAPGGGKGAEFHQAIRGVTYTAPLPKERAVLRLMRLDVQDVGMPVAGTLATPGAGDAEGALLALHLRKAWVWTSEYAIAHNNLDTLLPSSRELFGRAWRSAIAGTLVKTALTLSYRDVSSDYATPINPSLSQGGNGNRRGLDVSATRPTSIGNFTLTYNFLQSDVRRRDRPGQSMHNVVWSWSKSVTATTEITIGGLDTHTQTGKFSSASPSVALEVDKSQIGFNTSVTQRIGAMTLAVTGKREWSRDQVTDKQNVITSAINVSANGKVKSFFQLDSNISSNWTAGEPFSAGATRMFTSYVQPILTWQRTSLSIAPLLSITKTTTRLGVNQLTADTLTRNSGVRLSWKMPGQLKFSTLGIDGGWIRSRNGLIGIDVTTPRLLVLWTLLGGTSKK
jgi:hypothetical protein